MQPSDTVLGTNQATHLPHNTFHSTNNGSDSFNSTAPQAKVKNDIEAASSTDNQTSDGSQEHYMDMSGQQGQQEVYENLSTSEQIHYEYCSPNRQ